MLVACSGLIAEFTSPGANPLPGRGGGILSAHPGASWRSASLPDQTWAGVLPWRSAFLSSAWNVRPQKTHGGPHHRGLCRASCWGSPQSHERGISPRPGGPVEPGHRLAAHRGRRPAVSPCVLVRGAKGGCARRSTPPPTAIVPVPRTDASWASSASGEVRAQPDGGSSFAGGPLLAGQHERGTPSAARATEIRTSSATKRAASRGRAWPCRPRPTRPRAGARRPTECTGRLPGLLKT